ncbi:MCP four helix bundle domain-containing protein [Aquabacterium sp. OR-4]|uniref:MCP four helix bundle domain-containing protein n=1 Tax=Aquabacterium sp. OR-4 TaxID=2978127 RepID=UPI0021B33874|nr:MCP four helix bundle domain-containing protein [Aquabacterium sp. OR-4]MDT7836814.1 MCP four helix bundle domain-containing protein [Aquabacterium sp. OR-4]
MNLLHSLRHGQRFATALVLVLAVLGVLTGVSLSRAARLGQELERLEQVALPAARMVHDLALLADEARGLEALLLLLDDERERRDVEARLMQQRGRIAERLASQVSRLHDASDRKLLADVNSALGSWWSVQDQVLGAARAAVGNASEAGRARRLLAGESQLAYRQLLDTLERWWRHHDDLAQWSVKKARQEIALRLLPLLGGLLFATLAALLLALAQRSRLAAPAAVVAVAGSAAAAPAPAPAAGRLPPLDGSPAQAAHKLLSEIARQTADGPPRPPDAVAAAEVDARVDAGAGADAATATAAARVNPRT